MSKIFYIAIFTFLFLGSCQPPEGQNFDDFSITVLHIQEASRINPILQSGNGRQIIPMLFQKLLDFSPETLQLTPQLAKAPPTKTPITEGEFAGGVAYTFEINETAVWDNGTPITGHDVAFTLKTIFNPKVEAASVISWLIMIKDIEIDADNPKKFTIFTDRQYILGLDAISNIDILPAYVYDAQGLMKNVDLKDLTDPAKQVQLSDNQQIIEFGANFSQAKFSREPAFVIGSGPYELVEWKDNQFIKLQRKKDWWGDKDKSNNPLLKAYPETLIFKPIKDEATRLIAIKGGEVDVASQIKKIDFEGLKKDAAFAKSHHFFTTPTSNYRFIYLNSQQPVLQDKRVRRALAHLVDVAQLMEKSYFNSGVRTIGPVSPQQPYFHKGLSPILLDLNKAKTLLQEAGWADSNKNGILDQQIDGQLMEMEIPILISSTSATQKELALMLQKNAQQCGINIEIISQQSKTIVRNLQQRNYTLAIGTLNMSPTVLDDFMPLYHTSSDHQGGYNRFGFGTPETDALIEEINITMDEAKRNALYLKFQEILYDEQPQIFLFAPNEHIVVANKFTPQLSKATPGYYLPLFQKTVNE